MSDPPPKIWQYLLDKPSSIGEGTFVLSLKKVVIGGLFNAIKIADEISKA